MSDKNEDIEYGFIAGVLAGLVAGLIFAPTDGKKSREKIKTVITDLNEKYGEDIEEAKQQVIHSCDVLSYNIERRFKKLVNKIRAKRLRKAKELECDYEFDAEIN